MTGSNSPRQPREGQLHHLWTNNLIDNAPVRIIGNHEEKMETKGKLTIAAFSWKIASGEWWWWDLIPSME